MIRLLWMLAACRGGAEAVPAEPTGSVDTAPAWSPSGMEAFGLLGWDGAELHYDDDLVPYALATPLFSDHALKRRALRLPAGTSASYVEGDEVLDLPVGTVLLKSFLFPADLRAPDEDLRIIETRVLQKTEEGWEAEPWLWDGDTARFAPSGGTVQVDVIGLDGEPLSIPYLVPQKNQCIDCHARVVDGEEQIVPIGPKARHLHRGFDYGDGEVNQLQHLAEQGLLDGLPPLDDVPHATDARQLEGADLGALPFGELEAITRDYLDINCAHCHNPDGAEGVSSQLFLQRGATEPFDYGVCKRPGSAGLGNGGLTYDIVPGDHAQSILWFRMHTEQVGAMMPDIGRSVRHDLGVELVQRWIDGLDGDPCDDD